MTDYRSYRLTLREHAKCFAWAVGLTAVIAFLFYDSAWGVLILPVVYVILQKRARAEGLARVQARLGKEFLDVLRTVSSALLAGLSMENACREAERELAGLYGEDSLMGRELAFVNGRVGMNLPLEQQLAELAERSGNADIAGFAEVFAFAKRSGGNLVTIMEATAERIRARFETETEIQVMVASRRLEQKIMNIMPLLILAYLKTASKGFLDVLYRNVSGVLFMSGCLLAYGGALLLSERLLKIEM